MNPDRSRTCKDFRSSGRPAPGGILIAVLIFLTLASFFLLKFVEEATAKIRYYGLFYNRDDLRTEAYSALETTLAVIDEIHEIDGALYSPVQGWGNPLEYAQLELPPGLVTKIAVEDETSKLSLNRADQLSLNILFEEIGIDFADAEILTDSLLDWIDSDDLSRLNGAEVDYYENSDVPYKPANAAIQSWEEFGLIRHFDLVFFDELGLPNTVFRQFKEAISLHHSSELNLNSANPLALDVLGRVEGYDTQALYQYLIGDDGERGTDDDRMISSRSSPYFPPGAPSRGGMAGLRSSVLKVIVSVERGGGNFLLTSIVSWTGSNPSANLGSGGDQGGSGGIPQRGSTAPQRDLGAALGYPFEVIRITENFKI